MARAKKNAVEATPEQDIVVSKTNETKADLRFADYKKFNASTINGLKFELIMGKDEKRFTKISSVKTGKIVLLIGGRKDGKGTWNLTELHELASEEAKEETKTEVAV